MTLGTKFDAKIAFFLFTTFVTSHLSFDLSINPIVNRVKTQYTCSECGAISPKWIGNCPSCDSWNTYQEERIVKSPKRLSGQTWPLDDSMGQSSKPSHISKIESFKVTRALTKDKEFDRVMGGGIVPGSITLIGGDPGVGKSTLLLQIVLKWSGKSLYASG